VISMKRKKPKKPVSLGRHEQNCKICKHPERENIERDFIAWRSPVTITEEYELSNRATVYRHAHAFGLFVKRQRNIRAALERIIERTDNVEVNASAVVAAVVAYSKINSEGRFVERSERVDLNALFEKMSKDELLKYAEIGKLPDWFEQTVGKSATAGHGAEAEDAL
jgi:hypothetical protein